MTKFRRIPRLRISARRDPLVRLSFSWIIESVWDQYGLVTSWEGVYPTWHSAVYDLPNVAASVFTRRFYPGKVLK